MAENITATPTSPQSEKDYRIPLGFRANTPQRLEDAFSRHRTGGFFSEYPFGTDLTAEEIVLARALKFAELFAALSQLTDISTRRIVRLTWWLCGLTIGLLLIAVVQTVMLLIELKSKAP